MSCQSPGAKESAEKKNVRKLLLITLHGPYQNDTMTAKFLIVR